MNLPLDLVPVGEHTSDDLAALLDADEAQPLIERIPLLAIHNALLAGTMRLWRLRRGTCRIVTEIQEDHGTKRLAIVRGAGQLGFQFKAVMRQMAAAAQEVGCECVVTVAYSDRLKTALERGGARAEGFIMTYSGEGHG